MKNSSGHIMSNVFKKLLIIQIFAVITATIGGVVDGVIISRFLGREAMAAFSLVNPLYILFSCVANLMGNGAQTICGQAIGRSDESRVNGIFSLTLITILIVGFISAILVFLCNDSLAGLLGANGESRALGADYIKGLSFGAIAIMLNGPIVRFLQLDKSAKLSFVGVLVMTIVNISGDLLNAFVFKQGMFGMALATSISYYAAIAVLLPHFFSSKASIHLDMASIVWKDIKDLVVIGLPTAIEQVCNVLKSLCLNRIFMLLAGTLFVAAYAGQNTISSLINSIGIGVGMTSLLVCSVIAGEEDRTSLIQTVKSSLITSTILNTAIALLVFMGADVLASLFGKGDIETKLLSAKILRIYAVGLPFSIISTVFQNYFQSIKKMKLVNIICVCRSFLFMVAYAVLLPVCFGKDSVWFLFPLSNITTLLLIFIIIVIHNHGIPKNFEQLLMLEDSFGVPAQDRIDLTVTSMEQVMDISRQIEHFCKEHGIDNHRSTAGSLAMEELAGNIVKHGFQDEKKHSIDVRLSYKAKADILCLRLKDDCKPFNPKEQMQLTNPNNPAENLGIRTAWGLAKNITYQNTFQLNVLMIEL